MSKHHFPVAGASIGGLVGLVGLGLYGVCRAVGGLFGSSHKQTKQYEIAPVTTRTTRTLDVIIEPSYDHPLDNPNHEFHPENQVIRNQQRKAAQQDYERRTAFMRTPKHQQEMNEVINEFDRLVNKRLAKQRK